GRQGDDFQWRWRPAAGGRRRQRALLPDGGWDDDGRHRGRRHAAAHCAGAAAVPPDADPRADGLPQHLRPPPRRAALPERLTRYRSGARTDHGARQLDGRPARPSLINPEPPTRYWASRWWPLRCDSSPPRTLPWPGLMGTF